VIIIWDCLMAIFKCFHPFVELWLMVAYFFKVFVSWSMIRLRFLHFMCTTFKFFIINDLMYWSFYIFNWTVDNNFLSLNLYCGTGAWNLGLLLKPLHHPCSFVLGIFKIRSHELFAPLALNPNPPDICLLSR
jgi:hypothetical protein